jgi:myo-inositol-1-phosphate synthase
MLIENFQVQSPNVQYTEDAIQSQFDYTTTDLKRAADGKGWIVEPKSVKFEFKTARKVPKLG